MRSPVQGCGVGYRITKHLLTIISDSGMTIPGTGGYSPDCFWIDANGDQPVKAFQVNWVDMKADDPSLQGQNASRFCDSPSFQTYTNDDQTSIVYWTPTNPKARWISERSVSNSAKAPSTQRTRQMDGKQTRRSFSERFGNVLVVDDLPEHTATSLCESATSSGPDFVNPDDGVFCDMKTKTMYPLCNNTLAEGSRSGINATSVPCFDLRSQTLSEFKHVNKPPEGLMMRLGTSLYVSLE